MCDADGSSQWVASFSLYLYNLYYIYNIYNILKLRKIYVTEMTGYPNFGFTKLGDER